MTDAISRLPVFSFLWPGMLWLLALVLVLSAGYVWLDGAGVGATRRCTIPP